MTAPLALRAAGGDPAAWREIVSAYGPMLHVIAHRDYRLSAEDADDAVQETWVSLLRHADVIDPASLRGWLAVVMRNACVTRIRRERRYVPYSGWPEFLDRPVRDFADDVAGALGAPGPARIAEALRALPGQQRRALTARMEGRSVTEVAAELGVTAGCAKGHLHRARAAFRAALERPAPPPVPGGPLPEIRATSSTGQVAALAGVSRHRVLRDCADGEIPYTLTPGGHHRYRRGDVLAWLQRRGPRRWAPPELAVYEQRRAEFTAWLEAQLTRESGEAA